MNELERFEGARKRTLSFNALHVALDRAPSCDEGEAIVRRAFAFRRADRFTIHLENGRKAHCPPSE